MMLTKIENEWRKNRVKIEIADACADTVIVNRAELNSVGYTAPKSAMICPACDMPEIRDEFDVFLDSAYGSITIGPYEFKASEIARRDPYLYAELFDEWMDGARGDFIHDLADENHLDKHSWIMVPEGFTGIFYLYY